MRLPDFLIIGEMKCGTTTLWDLLIQHPRIFEPQAKELHFFGSYSYFGASGTTWPAPVDPYARHFEAARPDQLVGEATPNYLSDPLAGQRIAEALPDVRLLVILRDPVERAWSHYWHQIRRGWETVGFEEALRLEPDRIKASYDNHEKFSYITRGRYIEHLRRYEQQFGRERLCVFTLDELRRDPQTVADRAWAHLGLEGPYPPVTTVKHHNRANYPKWPRLDRLTRRTMRVAESIGGPMVSGARCIGRLTRSWRTYAGSPRMSDAVRQQLQDTFVESDGELAGWLGRPLPWREAEPTVDLAMSPGSEKQEETI